MKVTLRAARVNAGYTTEEAAKAAGVSKCSIIAWENGKNSPTVSKVLKLLDLYKTPIEDVIFLPNDSN